jgi:signal transduction histidine kinase
VSWGQRGRFGHRHGPPWPDDVGDTGDDDHIADDVDLDGVPLGECDDRCPAPPWERRGRMHRLHHRMHRRMFRDWRHHPWLDPSGRGPWAWYLRARLQKRVFFACGLAIAVGAVAASLLHDRGDPKWWAVITVFVLLWIGAGMIAWQLARPFVAVVRAAREIGNGKLSTRIDTHHGGELGALAGAINDMARRIEKQMRDQRQLLAVVSHELRTPLGHMRVLLETGRDTGGADARLIDELEREVIDLDRLVDRLLASSRLEFATLDRRKIDLVAIAVNAVETAGVPADRLSVDGDVRAFGDATLLRRAIANLLDNARVHGGGAVAVCVARRGGEVVVTVDDDGPGVPAERREAMFEAFARGGDGGSLGLGLALVRRIAAAHGGRAWIEDRPGGGARVGFSISLAPVEPAPSTGRAGVAADGQAPGSPRR